jgi:hypothetical protein
MEIIFRLWTTIVNYSLPQVVIISSRALDACVNTDTLAHKKVFTLTNS